MFKRKGGTLAPLLKKPKISIEDEDRIIVDEEDDPLSKKNHHKIIQQRPTIQFTDLFCGIGGFHIAMEGLKTLGFDSKCIWACDINRHCCEVYKQNFDVFPWGDINSIITINNIVPSHDILFAGFPCQPWSSGGKMKGYDDIRSKPLLKLFEIIEVNHPKVFVLENVKNLMFFKGGSVFVDIKTKLRSYGYNVSSILLNTNQFGLPQNRERIFIIGTSKRFKIPEFDIKPLCIHASMFNVDSSDGDFPKMTQVFTPLAQRKLKIDNSDVVDPSQYTILNKSHWKVQKKSGILFCGYINGSLRKTGVLPNMEHKSSVHRDANRIYHIRGALATIRSGESGMRYYVYDDTFTYFDKIIVRKLRCEELFMLMGFPSTFKRCGKSSKISASQIGNAVAPPVVTAILKEMISQSIFTIK